jgi:hypothetical protein
LSPPALVRKGRFCSSWLNDRKSLGFVPFVCFVGKIGVPWGL